MRLNAAGPARPALFLDRDGVINVDHAYVYQRERFEFIDGIFELCQRAHALGYWIFVVTNQAGIGRGYYTEEDFHTLTDWMRAEFAQRGGAIDQVYFCPSHPVHGIGAYQVESPFRKPGPGMLLQAASEFPVDMRRSLLVGDKESDLLAAASAGVGTLVSFRNPAGAFSDAKVRDVAHFVDSLAEVQALLQPSNPKD